MLRNLPNNYTRDAWRHFLLFARQSHYSRDCSGMTEWFGMSNARVFQADFNKWITSRYFSDPLWITDADVASWGWKKYFRLPDYPAPNLFPKQYCQSISAPVHFCWGHAVGAYWQLGLSRPVCAAFELSLPNVSAWANISCANMTNTPTKLPEPGFSFVELPEPVFSLLWIQTTPRAEEIRCFLWSHDIPGFHKTSGSVSSVYLQSFEKKSSCQMRLIQGASQENAWKKGFKMGTC